MITSQKQRLQAIKKVANPIENSLTLPPFAAILESLIAIIGGAFFFYRREAKTIGYVASLV